MTARIEVALIFGLAIAAFLLLLGVDYRYAGLLGLFAGGVIEFCGYGGTKLMAMLGRPVDPRLCQKVQCGVVSPAELTPDVLEECVKQGYTGTKSPQADECRQYFPAHCQVGPLRAFPDVSDAWPRLGPSVADVAALWPAMPEQAVAMPDPLDYATVDSGGVAMTPGQPTADAGYPYSPGVYPVDQTMQPSTDTGLDQMAATLKWPWTVQEDPYTPNAPTPDIARYTTLPAGPSTFLQPLPTITPIHGRVSGMDAAWIEQNGGAACRAARWIDDHKALAVAGLMVFFLAMTGGGRGR